MPQRFATPGRQGRDRERQLIAFVGGREQIGALRRADRPPSRPKGTPDLVAVSVQGCPVEVADRFVHRPHAIPSLPDRNKVSCTISSASCTLPVRR